MVRQERQETDLYQLAVRFHPKHAARSFAEVYSVELHVPRHREDRLEDDNGISQLGRLLLLRIWQ